MSQNDPADLRRMHDLMARHLTDLLENGEIARTKQGEVVVDPDTGKPLRIKPTASTLNVIRQFLKDNNVDALPADGSPLSDLLGTIPQFDDEFGKRPN